MKTPLSTEFKGYKVYSSGPNTQGFALLRALNGVVQAQPNPASVLDRAILAQQFLATNAVRDQYLGDPKFGALEGDALMQTPVPTLVTSEYKGRPMGDTVGISVASPDGYAVSLIQSVYFQFGAAVLEPNTGILFQNRATSFSLEAAAVNSYAPGKRPSHTLMPVLVTVNDHLKYVLATMGGQGQPQIHAQIFASMIEGDDPAHAVQRARWLVGRQTPEDGRTTVTVEQGTDQQLVERFEESGLQIKLIGALSDVVGHANIVAVDGAGKYEAASDPRSDGSARVV